MIFNHKITFEFILNSFYEKLRLHNDSIHINILVDEELHPHGFAPTF